MIICNDLEVKGKIVFLRVDFNVPLDDAVQIRDDTRIKAALPTLEYLLEHSAKVIVASHLGRPKGKANLKFSLNPVAERLSGLIGKKVILAPDVIGEKVDELKQNLKEGDVLLLENLRFHPGEEANDAEFAQELAKNIDCYVNDAFGACHRAHASVVGIPVYVEKSAAGFLLIKELEYLNKIIHSPVSPYVAILGGAKVSDKIPIIRNLLNKADHILIGGAMAYTFFSAQGLGVGRSLVEEDKKEMAIELLFKAKERNVGFRLPLDHVVAAERAAGIETKILDSLPIPSDLMALDIGPNTIKSYAHIISESMTILWNGPMGVFEIDEFANGTMKIAQAVADSKALSIVGGGDSVAAVYKAGVSDKISHISTGGGASLEYIADETLPGLEALMEN
ncbi:MAG: phosphoglycerate kinase [Candidatus Aminicenantes bacterium]|nr:phosphoglycerate kinase [Candidatus Aminicenantes bacterium]